MIARKFNQRFGKFFPEPQAKLTKTARVMSLTNSSQKMSKSLGKKSYIALDDSRETIEQKIKSAVTDEQGAKNLIELLGQFSADKTLINKFTKVLESGNIKYSELKPALASAINDEVAPIREKINYYLGNSSKLSKILENGAKQAKKIATKNLVEIKKQIGL